MLLDNKGNNKRIKTINNSYMHKNTISNQQNHTNNCVYVLWPKSVYTYTILLIPLIVLLILIRHLIVKCCVHINKDNSTTTTTYHMIF